MQRRQFLHALAIPFLVSDHVFAASLPADIVNFTAIHLSQAIRQGSVSCQEVMQAYLLHIQRNNPVYNAIVSMPDDELLLAQAQDADQALARGNYRGWMHGMPHAVKDLQAVAGLRFTSGSRIFAERIAESDSDLVARIRSAGAIFIGKTNTPEFGLGSQSYNSVFGATGSACNPALTAGGSSGGAASGLGTHMLPVTDGSDSMGSLRNPGAFNNVIGFRPGTNVMSGNTSTRALSTAGPMGRNTADTIQLLQTIAVSPLAENFIPLDLKGIRIGWLGNMNNYLAMETGVLELCEANLAALVSAGANVEAVQPNFSLTDLWQCWTTLRHSARGSMKNYYDDAATRPLLKPELVWEIEQSMLLTDADRAAANTIHTNWVAELNRLFTQFDFLILPTAQVFPFPKQQHWPQQINGRVMDTYHRWMEVVIYGSLGGIPVLNVPAGFDAQGRPMGMQIMGQFGQDKKVLEFGLAYELITNHLQRRPQLQ